MTFAQDAGYTPVGFDEIMDAIRVQLNTQFNTTYTAENFVGTNWYKYFYALVQKIGENETKTAEIFLKLQEYIAQTNDRIQRPSVSNPGILDSLQDAGYIASVKKQTEEDAGKISICVQVDSEDEDYAETKLEICNLIKDYVVGGVYSLGTETEVIHLSNGQAFEFSYFLPNYIPVKLRLTLYLSVNSPMAVPSDEVIRQKVFDNIAARYRLGWNFEPQRYFEILDDAPYAESVLLEWTANDGDNWYSEVFTAEFDDLFTIALEDIQVTVNA